MTLLNIQVCTLQVLRQPGSAPNIMYEYSEPLDDSREVRDLTDTTANRYQWRTSDWDLCSALCGAGRQCY